MDISEGQWVVYNQNTGKKRQLNNVWQNLRLYYEPFGKISQTGSVLRHNKVSVGANFVNLQFSWRLMWITLHSKKTTKPKVNEIVFD